MVSLMLIALVPAALAAWLHPRRPDFRPRPVADGEMKIASLRAQGRPILWIDARSRGAFDAGHIQGAIWLGDEQWEDRLLAVLEAWQPGSMIVVYCDASDSADRRHVARRLKRETGLDGVYTLRGSWREWGVAEATP